MKNLLGVVFGAALVFVLAEPATAQIKGTPASRYRMAIAMCTTGPCNPSYNFKGGTILFKKIRQPKPLTRREIGRIRVDGVSSTGPPLPTSLDGVVTARVNYGPMDPDGDCAGIGTDTTQVVATSSMFCTQKSATSTSCRGEVVVVPGILDDINCTDTQLYLSEILVEVYEDGGVGNDAQKIAQNGILATGKSPDCNSGGQGCP